MSPQASGGAGTIDEYRLATITLVALLRGDVLAGLPQPVLAVGLQRREAGNTLDDLVLQAALDHDSVRVEYQVKLKMSPLYGLGCARTPTRPMYSRASDTRLCLPALGGLARRRWPPQPRRRLRPPPTLINTSHGRTLAQQWNYWTTVKIEVRRLHDRTRRSLRFGIAVSPCRSSGGVCRRDARRRSRPERVLPLWPLRRCRGRSLQRDEPGADMTTSPNTSPRSSSAPCRSRPPTRQDAAGSRPRPGRRREEVAPAVLLPTSPPQLSRGVAAALLQLLLDADKEK